MGPTIATAIILDSKLSSTYRMIHLDTSDRRDLSTLGTIDFHNIFLAFKHYAMLVWLIISNWPSVVYIPISQTTIGYLRDAGFILIAKLFGRKVICHLRGGNFKNWYDSASFLTRMIAKALHSQVAGQIVLGDSLRHLFMDLMVPHKIFVVPNGRDFPTNGVRAEPSDNIKVLYLANFIRSKGALEALRAAPKVQAMIPNVEFIFAGSWLDESVKKEFDSFRIQHSNLGVVLAGSVSGQTKYDLLAKSDIFVFPTYYSEEGHPWVLVEAMAAGLPIISTDQGAIKESVIDGLNGFIVEKRNPAAIAEKLLLLCQEPELRRQMGQESRRLYEENFTEKIMVQRLSHVFETVLAS